MNDNQIMDEFVKFGQESLRLKDENYALKARVAELEVLVGSVNDEQGDFKGLGTNMIKANAIREAIVEARDAAQMYDRSGVIEFCTVEDLNEHADKVERGES